MSDILVRSSASISRGTVQVCGFASGRAIIDISVDGVTLHVHVTQDDLRAIAVACMTVRNGMAEYAQVAA